MFSSIPQSSLPATEPAYGRIASVHLCCATRQNPSGRLDEFGYSVRDVQSAARRFRLLPERHPVFECGKCAQQHSSRWDDGCMLYFRSMALFVENNNSNI